MNQQIATLMNLAPETVAGIEGVRFEMLASALPGVIEVSDSINEVEDLRGKEIDVGHEMRLTPDTGERMVVMDKFIVAGGLCFDSDHRIEDLGDCNGNIFHRGRRASGDEEANFYDAFGMTSDGERCYDAVEVCEVLADMAWQKLRTDRSLRATLQHMLKRHDVKDTVEAAMRAAAAYGGSEDDVAQYFAGVYAMYRLYDEDQERLRKLCDLFESLKDDAWEKAVATGKLGNPLAIPLDIYEHGGVAYSVHGGGMQCRWDTTSNGAVWVPDKGAEENIRYNALVDLGVGQVKWHGACGSATDPLHARYSLDGEAWAGNFKTWHEAVDAMLKASGKNISYEDLERAMQQAAKRYCKGYLESYNAAVNGDVYGVVIYVIDRETGERIEDDDDECWGYVGSTDAEETLEQAILDKVVRLGATKH